MILNASNGWQVSGLVSVLCGLGSIQEIRVRRVIGFVGGADFGIGGGEADILRLAFITGLLGFLAEARSVIFLPFTVTTA